MNFAFGALERQVLQLKSETLSLQALDQELVQNALSASRVGNSKKLDSLPATILIKVLLINLNIDRCLAF